MAASVLNAPHFQNEQAAFDYVESRLWSNGPTCPHCGNADPKRIHKMTGETTRMGLRKCNECRKPFTVTVGTVMERSKIPLSKWVLAAQLMSSSKKGFSALQLQRMVGTNYETAWFLFHRLREAATDPKAGPIGGSGKVVEADETYIGAKARNMHPAKRAVKITGTAGKDKIAVMGILERGSKATGSRVRTKIVDNTRKKVLQSEIREHVKVADDQTCAN